MHPPNRCREAEDILMCCVHDMRQPLGTIETSVFILSLLLGDLAGQVPEHLRTIERQVEVAAQTLNEAVAELRRLRAQRTEVESLDFTKSETAAVT
jgi:signal transduction histidine kinase